MTGVGDVFDDVGETPDPDLAERYRSLVGIGSVKARLEQQATLLLLPGKLVDWSQRQYNTILPAVSDLSGRTPLIILSGDVGTGKTALASTFADTISRSTGIDLTVYHLGLSARGQGAVGR